MAKTKISKRQKASSENIVKVDRALIKKRQPLAALLKKENILAAITECLQKNDFAGILEIVQIYLRAVKRAKKI